MIVHDALTAGLSFYLACFLRLGPDIVYDPPSFILYGTPSFVVLAGAVFAIAGLHRGMWRHASTTDLLGVTKAATVAALLFLLLMFVVDRLDTVPRSVPVIQWLLLVVMLGGSRFAFRLFQEQREHRRLPRPAGPPALLVGTGEGSTLFIRAAAAGATEHRPVAILDPLGRGLGRSIHGVPVFGNDVALADVIVRLGARGLRPVRVIFTGPIDATVLRRVVGKAEALGLATAQLPNLINLRTAIDDGRVELQPIALQELLGRPQVALDVAAIGHLIVGCRVLVTGAGGSIGSELVRQIAAWKPKHLALVDNSEFNLYAIDRELEERYRAVPRSATIADIRDPARIRGVFAAQRPQLVFHVAALKHVPMVERNPIEGVLTNVVGTRNVADAACALGVRAMVQVSSDKAVNPASVMGATKRLAELYCQALDLVAGESGRPAGSAEPPRFMTVRFGNVLGSSGSVVPLFQRQLAEGGALTVTHPDIRRYFMTIREASELVLQASAYCLREGTARGTIFVLDMGEPIRIIDIARQVIRLAGKEPGKDVGIRFTGLRPGEKLYEELFDPDEVRIPTSAPGVLAARSHPMELATLRDAFGELARACRRQDEASLRGILTRIVPGYGEAAVGERADAAA